jgi:REP element-mobilizing transposase RayT
MELSQTGIVADNNIIEIEQHIKDVRIINHVVMTNHIHLILWIHHSVGSPYMVTE